MDETKQKKRRGGDKKNDAELQMFFSVRQSQYRMVFSVDTPPRVSRKLKMTLYLVLSTEYLVLSTD